MKDPLYRFKFLLTNRNGTSDKVVAIGKSLDHAVQTLKFMNLTIETLVPLKANENCTCNEGKHFDDGDEKGAWIECQECDWDLE